MSELPKTFDPSAIEQRWYEHWESKGLFRPERPDEEPWTIVMPPPNVTGSLHIGHALDDHLRGDAGMVGADHPQSILAAHPLAAGQNVLKRIVERMADVQRAGDVGRRHDDRPRLFVRTVGPEEPLGLPMLSLIHI